MASQHLSLPRLFPEAPVLNRPVWERHIDLKKHGLVFEEGKEPPPLTKREYIETERMASEVEHGQGITILTLPKGLTLNKIIAFAGAPKMGISTEFRYFAPELIAKYGDKEIEETITVVVTNGVFNKSRNISVEEQEALVKGLNCEMPELVPFMAHIILSFIRSDRDAPERLFGHNTYTRPCKRSVATTSSVGASPRLARTCTTSVSITSASALVVCGSSRRLLLAARQNRTQSFFNNRAACF